MKQYEKNKNKGQERALFFSQINRRESKRGSLLLQPLPRPLGCAQKWEGWQKVLFKGATSIPHEQVCQIKYKTPSQIWISDQQGIIY